MYLLAINQALLYGCIFVTYGHPEGSDNGVKIKIKKVKIMAKLHLSD